MASSDPLAGSIAELKELFACETHAGASITRFVEDFREDCARDEESKNAQQTAYLATRPGIEPTINKGTSTRSGSSAQQMAK